MRSTLQLLLGLWSWPCWVLLAGAGVPVAAQEFEFRPQPADPIPTLPLLPSSSSALPAVPQVPELPLTEDPTAPAGSPIPLVPFQAAPSDQPAAGETYAHQRRPDLSPGGNLSEVARGELPPGTVIPLTVYRPITFQPYQAINSHLEVSDPVVDRFGQVVIPAGSVVWGAFEPVYRQRDPLNRVEQEETNPRERIVASRFVANRITIGPSTYLLRGQSSPLPVSWDPNAHVGTTVARGAGYGAAGGLALGVLTGGWGFLPILAGGLAGAAAGSTNIDRVVTLQPNTLVELELTESLIIQ